jgi:hypothetical protein
MMVDMGLRLVRVAKDDGLILLETLFLEARPRRLDHLGFGRPLARRPCEAEGEYGFFSLRPVAFVPAAAFRWPWASAVWAMIRHARSGLPVGKLTVSTHATRSVVSLTASPSRRLSCA